MTDLFDGINDFLTLIPRGTYRIGTSTKECQRILGPICICTTIHVLHVAKFKLKKKKKSVGFTLVGDILTFHHKGLLGRPSLRFPLGKFIN